MTLSFTNNRIGISPTARGAWLAVVIVCVLQVIVADGQGPRSVRGIVKDDKGHALAGAIVQIEDRTTLQIRSYITSDDGSFHFENLFPDLTYHLRAKYSGISSRSKILSKFDSKSIAVIDLTIQLSR
jgi:Carboxypeptidase regulatory-like domain